MHRRARVVHGALNKSFCPTFFKKLAAGGINSSGKVKIPPVPACNPVIQIGDCGLVFPYCKGLYRLSDKNGTIPGGHCNRPASI